MAEEPAEDATRASVVEINAVHLKDRFGEVEKLIPDQREALILVGASGFSCEEAAAICGCAVGTIKSRVHRARTKLVELLSIDSSHRFGPDQSTQAIMTVSARGSLTAGTPRAPSSHGASAGWHHGPRANWAMASKSRSSRASERPAGRRRRAGDEGLPCDRSCPQASKNKSK